MKKICIIPARLGSSRFPGKPLADACGMPVLIHIAKRCLLSQNLDYVAVATCDVEIIDVCQKYGIPAIMTSVEHERCTDRVSEAVEKLDFSLNDNDFILMVQGDEILVTPEMLDMVIEDYQAKTTLVVNLLSRIYTQADHIDPNVVKVVSSPDQRALYLSRAPIPSKYRDSQAPAYQQTGVIGFAKSFLAHFSQLPQTPLEKIESIDMLRVLEHGLSLRVVYTDQETVAVDVPSDLERACEILKTDSLMRKYA
ncbi:MAG: 3-deoxy-manno-octulosonate cytidylyltransferase [Alphaproteobacteria bacterium]|nr:3-deoxy-manno-octulosonate cytidylyltransferase [Alphaproteobacteria bacterium]